MYLVTHFTFLSFFQLVQGKRDLNDKVISLKFIYSEKATKFCEISIEDLTITTYDKSTVEISQKFVAFSEYMNFTLRQSSYAFACREFSKLYLTRFLKIIWRVNFRVLMKSSGKKLYISPFPLFT